METVELLPFDFGWFANFEALDVAGQVDRMAALLADFGAELSTPWSVAMSDRGADAVDERFSEWVGRTRSTVLYWVGHGWATARDASLAHAKSPRRIGAKGIGPVEMAAAVGDWEAATSDSAWLLVIIDACKSARFAERLAAELDNLGGPRRIAVLGTSTASSTTLGAFTRELEAALHHTFAGNDAIPITQLVDELCRTVRGARRVLNLGSDAVLRRVVPARHGFAGPPDPQAELHTVLRDLPDDERRHFLPKAQGVAFVGDDPVGELGWHFVGRDDERQDLLTRLGRDNLVVVSGRAGSGKSALLGDLVVRSRPELASALISTGLIEASYVDPPRLDVAIQLTGLDTAEVLVRLAEPLDLAPPDPSQPVSAQLDDFAARLATRPGVARVVLDALDEAVDPLPLAQALRRVASTPQVTIVVGTRRSTHEGPDLPDPADDDLLDALGVSGDQVLKVQRSQGLTFRYLSRRLRPLVHAATASDQQVISAARQVAEIDQEFLYGQLAAFELLARPELVVSSDVVGALGVDHRSIFANAISRLAGTQPDAEPLLVALALAQGRGLPIRGGVWCAVASAVTDHDVPERAVHQLLDEAAPYLALDIEHGQTVYRLAHQTFVEYFTSTIDAVRAHGLIVTRALEELRSAGVASNPYWRQRTSAHCAEAGLPAWRQLEATAELDLLDPTPVASDAMRSLFGRGPMPPDIAAGIFAAAALDETPPADRAATRRLARARVAPPAPTVRPPDRSWWPDWAVTASQPVHAVLSGHTDLVAAVVAVPTADGRTLLATGGRDCTVRLWDPVAGQPAGEPIQGHTPVHALAALALPDGRTVVAVGGADGTVQLWDPHTGLPVGEPFLCHTRVVQATAAVPFADGRTLLATGSDDGTVRLWDPASRDQVSLTLDHPDAVWALAATTMPDGRTLLASGGRDATVRLWDPLTGHQVRDPLPGQAEGVQTLVMLRRPDGGPLLACGDGRAIRVWDLESGEQVHEPLDGHAGTVTALAAVALPDGQKVLAAGATDEVVLWDHAGGQRMAPPLRGHTNGVSAVAAVPVGGGRVLLASAGIDRTVRLWDPAISASAADPVARNPVAAHSHWVLPMAGIPMRGANWTLATGTYPDPAVHLWDVATGQQLSEPLAGHAGGVLSMATVALPGGDHLLATGGADNTVRLWNPTTGQPVGDPLLGHHDWVEAVTALQRPGRATLLATAALWTVRLWDLTTREPTEYSLTGATSRVVPVAALTLPDGRALIATSEGETVRLWDALSGARLAPALAGHTGDVSAMTALRHPDGRTLLVTGSGDRTVRLWDLVAARQVGKPLRGHSEGVSAVAAIPLSGRDVLLASGSSDKTVKIWHPDGRDLATIHVCAGVISLAPAGPARLAVGMRDGLAMISLGGELLSRGRGRRATTD